MEIKLKIKAEMYKEMLEEFCDPNIITMWQDGTTHTGHAGVLEEFDKLSEFISVMKVAPITEKRLILNNGSLVIASGQMNDQYTLRRGVDVKLNSKWTATIIKRDGAWKLVSFSGSSNAFDNEVVSLFLKQTQYTSGGIALGMGLLLGFIGILWSRKRIQNAPQPS